MTRVLVGLTALVSFAVPACAEPSDPDPVPPDPILWTGTFDLAGYGYVHHSERLAGGEGTLAFDAWQGSTWSMHLSYTPDVIAEQVAGVSSVANFHDLLLAGTWRPVESVPVWVALDGHGLLGSTTYSNGGAAFASVGGTWSGWTPEAGLGGVFLQQDEGLNAWARLSYRIVPVLTAAIFGLVTTNHPTEIALGSGGTHVAWGAELTLGPFRGATVDVHWLGGQRTLAMEETGGLVEDLPDIMRDTVTARVVFPIASRWSAFASASGRWATETTGNIYELFSAAFGVTRYF